ncbi:PREDICTED: phylloplanin-like [Camelina sativa]|uniref:Phylloplanin-like n=1 Tax=Camelina sativa TaxID=90675 RepID=A0ABM1RCF7_CAMSA|nr:PREDICTED: phylloplanin-like [Camelina sativa]
MALFKNKRMIFSLILVCLIVVSPVAEAQLGLGGIVGGLGGLGGLVGGIVGGLLNLVNVNGVIFCSLNGALNGTSTPVFANAGVQLQCGRQNRVVSTATTNAAGLFSLPTNAIQMLLSTLLSDCRVVVTTPLSTCNAELPSVGSLVSRLTMIGSSVSGLLSIVDIIPAGFNLLN